MARFGPNALLLLVVTSTLSAEPVRIPFPGLRRPPEAIRDAVQFEAAEGFAPARLRSLPVTCSGLVSAVQASHSSAVVVDYEGGMADEIEDLYEVDIRERDVVAIELDSADASADLDLILFDGQRIVALSNIEAVGRTERIVTPVTAGRYVIGVSAVQGSSAYTLRASLAGSSALVCEPVTELEWSPRPQPPAQPRFIEAPTARRRGVARPVRPPVCTYSVTPLTQSIAQSSTILTVSVTAEPGCDWRASSSASWMTLLWGGLAYGNGTAGFSVGANSGTSSRSGTLTVAGKSVSITQFGPCSYTVTPTSPQIAAAGGTNTLSVTTRSDCNWTASVAASVSWITITSGQSGAGDGTVTYQVAPNTSTSSRTGTMTVAGRSISVKQALDASSCTYSVAYTNKTLSWCGGQRSVGVTTQGECPWTASKDASWITLGGTNRSGSGSLFYLLERNTGPSRQATITVAGTPVGITQSTRSGSGTYDGVWKGTTAASRNVELCVADGALQDALVTVRLSFPTFTCTGPLTITDSVPISGSSFSGTFDFPGSNIFTMVRGTFSSPTAMSGSHDGYSGSYLIVCGSTVAFGTGGSVLSSGTYTATKQP